MVRRRGPPRWFTATSLAYVDDLLSMCATAEDATLLLKQIDAALRQVGLRVNTSKTFIMPINETLTVEGETDDTANARYYANHSSVMRRSDFDEEPIDVGVVGTPEDFDLHVPKGSHNLLCPHPRCHFVARTGLARSPTETLKCHLANRHTMARPRNLYEHEEFYPEYTSRELPQVPPHIVHGNVSFPWHPSPGTAKPLEGITLHEENDVKACHCFKYLGSKISSDGTLDAEIESRITAAEGAFHAFPEGVWDNPHLDVSIKMRLYNACVLSRLLYAGETWAPTTRQIEELSAVHIRHLRIITGLKPQPLEDLWQEEPTYWFTMPQELVLRRVESPCIADLLRRARLRLLGDMLRAPPMSVTAMWSFVTANPYDATRSNQKSWHEIVINDMLSMSVSAAMARNPKAWREMTESIGAQVKISEDA